MWPSDVEQQIAWLRDRFDSERARVEEQFVARMRKVGDAEVRANRRIDDVGTEISALASELVQLKEAKWLPRLGGTLLSLAGVIVTLAASA